MLKHIIFSLALACAWGCNGESAVTDGGQDGGYPDHTFVYEVGAHQQTAGDESFLQERPTLYRTTAQLADLDARALSVIGSDVWVGTAGGLYKFDSANDRFDKVALSSGDVAVVDLSSALTADGKLAVALADGVELLEGSAGVVVSVPAAVSSVAADGPRVWVGCDQGLYKIESGAATAVAAAGAAAVRDLAVDASGNVWLARSTGLDRFDGAQLTTFEKASGSLPDDDVRAVFAMPSGGVLAGCATGAALVGGADRILLPGVGSLPYDDITSVWASGDLMAFGHGIGATVVRGDFEHVDHYHSLRWIPAETVTAVALASDGTRWIATPAGVARVSLVSTTLSEKAALFDSFNEGFWRLDFVSDDGQRDEPWDTSQPIHNHDHDNDGLWTQMQIVAWSYAAAATGDGSFCDKARRAMGMMIKQIDIPAVSFTSAGMPRGFVTRSLVRDDEGAVFDSKATQDNWHLVENYEGHDYYWKDDTSSDETTGHYFGYPVFFDLCAKDDAERQVLSEHAGVLGHYIVDNDFNLIDLDGLRTTWGHWGLDTLPVALDGVDTCLASYPIDVCYSSAYGGGWLNAIEILGHLLAAYHMTGETEFYDAYLYLLDNRYGELVDFDSDVWTVTKKAVANHSDHELAMLAYHTLIRYEANPERRQRWIDSLLAMYAYELPERNPCWSAIISGITSDGYHLDEALRTLREWPEDWRVWREDNSHRRDAVLDTPDRSGDPQFTTVLPYDEIRTMKWNGNPYQVTDGGDGREVQAPWPWLLPYWMYRYQGVIE
ncbi:MAG TPA: hypothetical protein VM425_13565 [Myxococcota bacterium]|nr:hypothetical protein [Myxococcota bacterium]